MYCLKIIIGVLITSYAIEGSDLWASFITFKNQLWDFFHITNFTKEIKATIDWQKLKQRRQDIKKAFKNFVAEVTSSNTTKILRLNAELETKDLPNIEKNMSAAHLIMFHGYRSETHSVQTRDGYNLEIHRILSYSSKSVNGKNILALLHHGLMGSSDDWLLLGPTQALPYLLSDAGYDVWLTNARGNRYSRFDFGYLDSKSSWDFSFHEMGYFDLSAVIDYIERNTQNDQEIHYVGHSMGGTVLLTLLSTQPHYNQRLKSATLLAPLAYLFEVKGPLKMLADFYRENGSDSLDFLGKYDFLPKQNFPHSFIDKFCISTQILCYNPLLFLTNGGKMDTSKGFLETLLNYIPAGTSSKTIKHYLQLINSRLFKYFDYGNENYKKYGTVSEPSYNLKAITVPFILFSSLHDWLCTAPNMKALIGEIQNLIVHRVVQKSGFSHTDFVWGTNASHLVFKPLIEILETMRYN